MITIDNYKAVERGITGILNRQNEFLTATSRLGDIAKAGEILNDLIESKENLFDEQARLQEELELGFRVKGKLKDLTRFLDHRAQYVHELEAYIANVGLVLKYQEKEVYKGISKNLTAKGTVKSDKVDRDLRFKLNELAKVKVSMVESLTV